MNKLRHARYYGILDSGYVKPGDWIAKYDDLVAGGAHIVQIRAKSESPRQRERLLDLVLERRAARQGRQPHLVVNDDIELCLKALGIGLHVGQHDIPAQEARARLGPDRILGLSTHTPQQAQAAIALGTETLSYFAVGPVFATQTKPDYTPVGLELVRFVSAQKPQLPFFCIGGINRGNIRQVIAAGATRVVTVSDALCAEDTAQAVAETIALLAL